jgi:hypothetical protein
MGFLIMGVIGYIVKLSELLPSLKKQSEACSARLWIRKLTECFLLVHIPVNNILVGGA